MGKGSRLGAGACAKQQGGPGPAESADAASPEAEPARAEAQPSADAWSPLIRSSLVAERSRKPRPRELRSAWGEEPLHPRKASSRRLRLTQIAEERRERRSGG